MPIVLNCPSCRAQCSVTDSSAGQTVPCPICEQPLRVGSPARAQAPTIPPGSAPTIQTAAPAAVPAMIGRYQVRQKLGAGAFGAVYRAYDPQLDREVALKLLKPEALASPAAVERFRREAKAAAKMLHAHIVPVHDSGEHEGAGFIASAFIDGKPLSQSIPEGGLEPRQAVALAIQLLEALGYAHERGVVHRDVKPANCLVDAKGNLYLTDFGLAGSLQEAATRMTRLGAVLGTPAYLAPEQAAGATGHVGPHSDQYGAAVVLYELLTGQLPFTGPLDVVLFNVLRTQPQKPSSLRPDLDPELEEMCLKAMAKKPKDRYPDAAAFATALRGWLAEAKRRAKPPPLPEAAEPEDAEADETEAGTPMRHWALVVSACTLVVVLASTVSALVTHKKTRDQYAAKIALLEQGKNRPQEVVSNQIESEPSDRAKARDEKVAQLEAEVARLKNSPAPAEAWAVPLRVKLDVAHRLIEGHKKFDAFREERKTKTEKYSDLADELRKTAKPNEIDRQIQDYEDAVNEFLAAQKEKGKILRVQAARGIGRLLQIPLGRFCDTLERLAARDELLKKLEAALKEDDNEDAAALALAMIEFADEKLSEALEPEQATAVRKAFVDRFGKDETVKAIGAEKHVKDLLE